MYCKQCGKELKNAELKKCPNCNTTVGKGGRFCPDCGRRLKNTGEICVCKMSKSTVTKSPNVASPKIEPEKRDIPVSRKWVCLCGQENEGEFCASCGKPQRLVASLKRKEHMASTRENPVPTRQENQTEAISESIIPGNSLFAKIAAQEDRNETKAIIKEQAARIVYGDIPPEMDDSAFEPVAESETHDTDEADAAVVDVAVEDIKEPSTAPGASSEPRSSEPSNTPKRQEEKSDVPASGEKIPNVTEIFPEAFEQEKLSAPEILPPPIHKSVAQANRKHGREKSFEAFWVAGMLLNSIAFTGKITGYLPFVCLGMGMLFGLLDCAFNKKRYGIGVSIAAIIEIFLLILP